jgi:hypothetical protein
VRECLLRFRLDRVLRSSISRGLTIMPSRPAVVWSELLRWEEWIREQLGAAYPLVRLECDSEPNAFNRLRRSSACSSSIDQDFGRQ